MREEIEIPECEDLEWQVKQMKRLSYLLDRVYSEMTEEQESLSCVEEAQAIVEALREYSGY